MGTNDLVATSEPGGTAPSPRSFMAPDTDATPASEVREAKRPPSAVALVVNGVPATVAEGESLPALVGRAMLQVRREIVALGPGSYRIEVTKEP